MQTPPCDVVRCKRMGDCILTVASGWQVYRGMGDAARGIVQRQGVRGLYSGLNVTLLEIMPYAALQFGLYDLFTAAFMRSKFATQVGDLLLKLCLDRGVSLHSIGGSSAAPAAVLPLVTALMEVKAWRPQHQSGDAVALMAPRYTSADTML